jgi:hypothetical protein
MCCVLNLSIDPKALLVEMLFKLHICIDVCTICTLFKYLQMQYGLIDIAIHIKYF